MYRDKVKDERLARYCGAVTCMDEAIGELIHWLDDHKLSENTLVMFLLRQRRQRQRRQCTIAWREVHDVGRRAARAFHRALAFKDSRGKITDEFLTSLELVPTILAATGAKPPEGVKLDGFDMLPVLRDEAKSREKRCSGNVAPTKPPRFEN